MYMIILSAEIKPKLGLRRKTR